MNKLVVLKSRCSQIVIAAVAVLAILLARPNAALAAAPQHHDQVPGFYRLKVGDLEVTALYDGTGVFDAHPSLQRWHNAAAISFARRWMSDRNRGYSWAVGG